MGLFDGILAGPLNSLFSRAPSRGALDSPKYDMIAQKLDMETARLQQEAALQRQLLEKKLRQFQQEAEAKILRMAQESWGTSTMTIPFELVDACLASKAEIFSEVLRGRERANGQLQAIGRDDNRRVFIIRDDGPMAGGGFGTLGLSASAAVTTGFSTSVLFPVPDDDVFDGGDDRFNLKDQRDAPYEAARDKVRVEVVSSGARWDVGEYTPEEAREVVELINSGKKKIPGLNAHDQHAEVVGEEASSDPFDRPF